MHLYDLTVFWQIASMLQLSSTSAHSSTSRKRRKTGLISWVIHKYTSSHKKLPFRPEFDRWHRALLQFVTPDVLQRKTGERTKAEWILCVNDKVQNQNSNPSEILHRCGYKLGQVIFKDLYYYYFQSIEIIYFSSWTSVELLQTINKFKKKNRNIIFRLSA